MGRQHLSFTRWYMRHNCPKNTQHTSKQGGNRTSALPCSCWHTWRAKSSLAPAEGEQGLGSGAGMRWSTRCPIPDTPTVREYQDTAPPISPVPAPATLQAPLPLSHTPHLIPSNKDIPFLTAAIAVSQALGRIIQEPFHLTFHFLQLLYLSNEICSNIVRMVGEEFLISMCLNTHNVHSFIHSYFCTYVGYKHPTDKQGKTQQDKTSRAGQFHSQ